MSSTDSATQPPENLEEPYSHVEFQVLRDIWDRLHMTDQHAMICLVGEEGSGKSLTSLRLAQEIDPTFNADRVIFDVAELLRILNEGEHEPGQAYVLDEAGVSLGRRTWQERSQILANQALQLIRSHNLALFFTVPRMGELDSQTIGRLQAFYEITDKVQDQYVRGKWKYLDPDRTDSTGTIYHKKPRIPIDGITTQRRVDYLKFRPPTGDVVKEYKKQKQAHQNEVYSETLSEVDDDEEEEEELSPHDVVEQIVSKGPDHIVSIHGGHNKPVFDTDLIKLEYDTTVREAQTIKKLLDRDDRVEPEQRDTHTA